MNKRLLNSFDDGDEYEDDTKLDHQQHLFLLDVISSFSFGLCVLVCGGSTLGIKRPKTPCPRKWDRAPRPRDRNLDTSIRFLNDLWSIHGKMDIKFLFMDRNLDLCWFFLQNV